MSSACEQSSDRPTEAEYRRSWLQLRDWYHSDTGQTHFRFTYIVDRLTESRHAGRFTIGEAWLFQHDSDVISEAPSGCETIEDRAKAQDAPDWLARGLYLTTRRYGVRLNEVPHIVIHGLPGRSELFMDYCRGQKVISSHACEPRKEIPCLLSLLELLDQDR